MARWFTDFTPSVQMRIDKQTVITPSQSNAAQISSTFGAQSRLAMAQ
ncbi:hypothetical protein [Moraxella caviae]|nr:hypothetical protein [Moraxella caviae]